MSDVVPPPLLLVVEDDDHQREAVCEFFGLHGYEVIAWASGRDAVDWVRSTPRAPLAAVVDWHLPGLGGGAVVAAIRERFGPDLVVLVASGSPLATEERRHARWTVALRKPFSIRRLLKTLNRLVGTPS